MFLAACFVFLLMHGFEVKFCAVFQLCVVRLASLGFDSIFFIITVLLFSILSFIHFSIQVCDIICIGSLSLVVKVQGSWTRTFNETCLSRYDSIQ